MGVRKSANKGPRNGIEKRRADRHRTNALSCDLGDVVDVSMSGMRIDCPRKPPVKTGHTFKARLDSGTHRLPVVGRVVWIRRRGLKKRYSMGVQFVDISRSLQAAVESLALFGFIDLDAVAAVKEKQRREEQREAQEHFGIRVAAELPDYYALLGVPSNASQDRIRQAFRDLARKYHPDVASGREDERRFIEIKQAYEVLRDAESRETYDLRLAG